MKNEFFHNTLREKMKQRPVFGITIYTKSPQIIEVLGYQGFDFAFIDAEHCPWEVTDLAEAVLAARLSGVSPLVRVTEPNMIEIRKALEMGAEGVIIPHVHNKEEMELCVKAAKFPPLGRRGYDGNVRAAQYGVGLDGGSFIELANESELVIPMCEDFEFTDNIEEVMNVPGVDAINFGPADYSSSMNNHSFYDLSKGPANDALDLVLKYAGERNIGVMAPATPATYESAKKLIDRGVNMIIMGNDLGHVSGALKRIHDETVAKFL